MIKVQIQMANTNIDAADDWVQEWSDMVFTSYRLGHPPLICAPRPTVQMLIQIQKVQIQNDKWKIRNLYSYQLQTYKYTQILHNR